MKPSTFVESTLGVYSSHPRFNSRRLRAWTLAGALPLLLLGIYFCWQGAGVGGFFDSLVNWDFWAAAFAAAIWFFLGMVLTVNICIYLSGFAGANGGKRALAVPGVLIFGIGLLMAIVPVIVFVGFGRLMDTWQVDSSQKAAYLTYAASLSLLPLLVAFAALEIFGERRGRKKKREGQHASSALNGIVGLIIFALAFPSTAAWFLDRSPDWLKHLLPGGTDELSSAVVAVPQTLLMYAFQIVTIGSLILLAVAASLAFALVRAWAKESAEEDEEDKIKDPTRADFDHGPPSPLAIKPKSFQEQPRALRVKTKGELDAETEAAESGKREGETTVDPDGKPAGDSKDTKKSAVPEALTAVAVALGLMEEPKATSQPLAESNASADSDANPETHSGEGSVEPLADEDADDLTSTPEAEHIASPLIAEDEENPNPCERDWTPAGTSFSEIVQDYPGQEFGLVRPSLDQFVALQTFQKKWAEVADRQNVKTGSIEDTATLSAADMIIEGDPGCGRTTVLLAMAFHAVTVRGQSVLFIAPPGAAADSIVQRLAELFVRSSVGPFVSVSRLRKSNVEELAKVGAAKAESTDDAQRDALISKVGRTITIPDVAVVTADEYEQGFFGAAGSTHGLRALLHRYQVLLVDDILELDIWSRIHLPFLLDKHRLILGVDGYRFQTVVAASKMTIATRKLIEKRLFAAVGTISKHPLKPWDDLVTWKLDVPSSNSLNAELMKTVHVLLGKGLDVAVWRGGLTEVSTKTEATRLVLNGRGPRVVESLASLASTASEDEVATRDIPGSLQTPVPDPTLWRMAQDCHAIVAAYVPGKQQRIVVRFTHSESRAMLPTRVPIMASARSLGISCSHVGSVCRLVRPFVPSDRNLWAKLGLSNSEDERSFGMMRGHEAFEIIRKLEVDPHIGDHLSRSVQEVFPWVVLLPATVVSVAGQSEEIPPKPVEFNAARLHGFDLLRDAGDTHLQVVRRSVEEPFVSVWNTDQGLTAGRHDLSYAPHLRIGIVGETMQKGGAAFATRLTNALSSDATSKPGRAARALEPPRMRGISVECRSFESSDTDPYMPWWQLSTTLDVRWRGALDPQSVTLDCIGVLWPSIAWIDYEDRRRLSTGTSQAELAGQSRLMASLCIERLFSRRGGMNPVSPVVAFQYECSTSFMLFSKPERRDAINASSETLLVSIAETLGGTWHTAAAITTRKKAPSLQQVIAQAPLVASGASEDDPARYPSKAMTFRWSVPGDEGVSPVDLQIEWTLNLNLTRARVRRFGVLPAMNELTYADEASRRLRVAELRALALERGLVLQGGDGGEPLIFNVDYARLTMDGAADLRDLAERIIEAAVRGGITSDRRIAAAIVSFVQQAVEYRVPDRHAHSGHVDAEAVDRLGMKPAIATLFDGHGDCDCSAILAAALLHATGQFRAMGFRVTHKGTPHFLIGIQLPAERNDQSVEVDGVNYLPIETSDRAWRIGQSPTIGKGTSYTPEPLVLEEDLVPFELAGAIERGQEEFVPREVDHDATEARTHSPFLSAVLMVAFRRHVPQFESVCRIAGFRFGGNANWSLGVMFVEPAPTQRTVSETLREVLRDQPLLHEFFTTCARLCEKGIDELCAEAEQRLGTMNPNGLSVDPCSPQELKRTFEALALQADPNTVPLS